MINRRDLPTKAQRKRVIGAIGGTVAMPGVGVWGPVAKRVAGGVAKGLVRAGVRGAFRAAGRWFRGSAGKVGVNAAMRTARGGSAITSGKLILGKGQAFRAGGTAFNVANAAKVAAVGTGGAVAIGKLAQPRASVQNAASAFNISSPRLSSSPASSPRSSPASSSGSPRRCCPPGSRMLCFKRKHNPEAEAKRRARRKAAREKAKGKTAKRHAKERAAVQRRKTSRAARRVRRGVSAAQRAARARFAKAAKRGPIRKGSHL